MRIGILAVQGAFLEHEQMLDQLNIDYIEIRQPSDLKADMNGLILPGGESTVQRKLLKDFGLFEPLKKQIEAGLPVLATCAGMILLASHLSDSDDACFQTMPVTVRRNAYGRQLGSFHTTAPFGTIGKIPMTFIRAPYVESYGAGVKSLATVDNKTVAIQYKNQIALGFHPELDCDTKIYLLFFNLIKDFSRSVSPLHESFR